MRKLEPAQGDDGETWAKKVINVLRLATLAMLERILFFLPDELITDLYEWGIGILDKLFSKISPVDESGARRRVGISALQHIAQQSGVEITIKKKS